MDTMRNSRELEFAIFCIENVAAYLKKDAPQVYRMLADDSDILRNYIVPCYDALHTQGRDYIVNDIVEVMREKGLAL